ncbi:MAG: hypothetical protein IRZ11_00590 [Clostridia bacterium]|nr:hypothetical protein [Clostridia bacterium]
MKWSRWATALAVVGIVSLAGFAGGRLAFAAQSPAPSVDAASHAQGDTDNVEQQVGDQSGPDGQQDGEEAGSADEANDGSDASDAAVGDVSGQVVGADEADQGEGR